MCTIHTVDYAIKIIFEFERKVSEDPKLKELQASVGKAEYNGNKTLSFDELIQWIAIKYCQMTQTFQAAKN